MNFLKLVHDSDVTCCTMTLYKVVKFRSVRVQQHNPYSSLELKRGDNEFFLSSFNVCLFCYPFLCKYYESSLIVKSKL